jgi:hypothetical protein
MQQHDAQGRAAEGGADIKLALPQDHGDLVGDHVAHHATERAGGNARDEDDRPGGPDLPRHRHARGRRHGEGDRIEPEHGAVARLEQVRREEDEDRGAAGDAEVVRARDPEHGLAPEHEVAHRAAADAGEAGEEQEADRIELRARGGEAAGEREDEDGGEIEKRGGRHRDFQSGCYARASGSGSPQCGRCQAASMPPERRA